MKTSFLLFALALSLALPLRAQTTSPIKTDVTPTVTAADKPEREEVTGTIVEYTPEKSLVLHTGTDAGNPVTFRFATTVTYVDEDGKIVEAAGLRKNQRVRLSYLKAGADNIIDKVTILE